MPKTNFPANSEVSLFVSHLKPLSSRPFCYHLCFSSLFVVFILVLFIIFVVFCYCMFSLYFRICCICMSFIFFICSYFLEFSSCSIFLHRIIIIVFFLCFVFFSFSCFCPPPFPAFILSLHLFWPIPFQTFLVLLNNFHVLFDVVFCWFYFCCRFENQKIMSCNTRFYCFLLKPFFHEC